MSAPLPLLDVRRAGTMFLFMRGLCNLAKSTYLATCLLAILGSTAGAASYSVTVYLPTPQLQSDFIANATNQYIGTVSAGIFGTKVTLTDKNGSYVPPVVSSPIPTATAVDQCMAHGFAWGMETERDDDLKIIKGFRDDLVATGNCGGVISASTIPVVAYRDGCQVAYNILTSTITQKIAPPTPLFGR